MLGEVGNGKYVENKIRFAEGVNRICGVRNLSIPAPSQLDRLLECIGTVWRFAFGSSLLLQTLLRPHDQLAQN